MAIISSLDSLPAMTASSGLATRPAMAMTSCFVSLPLVDAPYGFAVLPVIAENTSPKALAAMILPHLHPCHWVFMQWELDFSESYITSALSTPKVMV